MWQKLLTLIVVISIGCTEQKKNDENKNKEESVVSLKKIGNILRLDNQIDGVIPTEANIEILDEGFDWTEGPLWVNQGQYLLFSDIPPNRVYKWKDGEGTSIYLDPSGYTGEKSRGGEPGSNGLLINNEGQLVLCQHGDQRLAIMNAQMAEPKSDFLTLVDNYQGKRLNSPNDAAFHSNGDLYFTDPPYGLEQLLDDPNKQIPFQGVYRLGKNGEASLLTDQLSRPNGIAFSPDEKTLYVANSDPEKAIWMAYDVMDDGSISNGRIFYDATGQVTTKKGLPDGLKVNNDGIIFATGPGGVFVFTPEAKLLGIIETGEATSNCALDAGQKTLYMTADMYLLKVKLI